jgi:hypothetical protein
VVGDSEIFQLEHVSGFDAYHLMTDQLVAAGYRATSSSMIGATTTDLFELMSTQGGGWPSPGPQILVTALGVNDRRINPSTGVSVVPLETSVATLELYLDATAAQCDVLMETPETTPWGLNVTAPAWNDELARIAAERNGVVVDWSAAVAANPNYVNPYDQVHQTGDGKQAYYAMIASAVGECAARISGSS